MSEVTKQSLTVEEEIRRAIDEFINAYNSGDIQAVLATYGDDLIKLRQGAPPETKPEVARRVAEVFNKFHSRVDVSNEEILVAGELAFTRGSFRVTLTPKAGGGETQTIDRRYLELWRKENGRWLVVRTMDNVG
jgi:ketosteroid isomerase-like protein